MSLERSELVASLTKKGFREQGYRSHDYYWLYVGEKKTAINTHVSRGKAYRTLGLDLVREMAYQLKLTTKQLRALSDCSLTADGYLACLRARNINLSG